MEIIKKNISIDKKFSKENTQVLIEGDLIVPDIKPDIDILLEANANCYLNNKEVGNNKISFKGNLDINVLFVAKGDDKNIYSIDSTYPINDFINIDGIDKNMDIFTNCKIANLDYSLINDRKVSFRAILDISAEVFLKDNFEIISEINGLDDSQMKKASFTINKIACSKFDRFNIKDEIEITSGKPNIKEVLQCNLTFSSKDVKVLKDKLNVFGNIKACILYKGDEDDVMPTYIEQEIPFNGSLEASGVCENMLADFNIDIQNKNINILEDSDNNPRIISLDIYVGCNIKVNDEQVIDTLQDVYFLNKTVNIDSNLQKYPILVCKNKNQAPFKDILKLDENCPPILQVIKVFGKPILDHTQILQDKVLAEGIIECNILYITSNDEYPIYCYKAIVPYSQFIEAKGLDKNMDVDINVNLEHIGVNMTSDKNLELRCVLNFDASIFMEQTLPFVVGVSFEDISQDILDNIGSMTIYVFEQGDTLWDLAKKYNTTVNNIVEVNNIEDEQNILPGTKLLILKKVY